MRFIRGPGSPDDRELITIPAEAPSVLNPVVHAGRIHLAASMLLLLAGVLHLAVEGIDYGTVLAAAPLVAGAFLVLIVGTSRMLLSVWANVELRLHGQLAYLPGLLVGSGSVAAYLALAGPWPGTRPGVVFFSAGLLAHLGLVATALWARRGSSPMGGGPVRVLVLAAMGYAVASAVALPAAALGSLGWLPALHLLLPGFIVVTILAVLLESLPRFGGIKLPPWIAWTMGLAGALGPGLVAAGLSRHGSLLAMGAVLEFTALALAGLGLLIMVLRARPWRDTHPLYGLAGISALAAASLGAGMATGHLPAAWAPLHGMVALFGFVGAIVFASSLDLYEPALARGPGALKAQAIAVTVLAGAGLGLLVLGSLTVARGNAAMVLYVGAVLFHLVGATALVLRPLVARRLLPRPPMSPGRGASEQGEG